MGRTGKAALAGLLGLVTASAACASDASRSSESGDGATTSFAPDGTADGTAASQPAASTESSMAGGTDGAVPTTGGRDSNGAYESVIVPDVVDNASFDALERDIVRRLTAVALPGASLLVVSKGELVEHEAFLQYGLDQRVPIASASKWLTAATIMTLVDEGLIDLDAPISTYAPQIPAGSKVGTITMRQLLSFTSGLVADERVPCIDTGEGDLQSCAAAILRDGLVHPPGDAFRYGSQHMHVGAAIAEIVAGVPFAELFQQRIARPLGMGDTVFVQIGEGLGIDDVTHPLPAGGAVSTLDDYGRFLEMLVHDGVAPSGERILSAEAIAEMQTNQITGARYASASEFRVAFEAPYGLGEWIDWTDENGNALVLSSDGKFGFRPWIDKVNDVFGVYLIYDNGQGYVDGDPDAAADDGGKVHTSGLWVFSEAAEAVGGSLPDTFYPD